MFELARKEDQNRSRLVELQKRERWQRGINLIKRDFIDQEMYSRFELFGGGRHKVYIAIVLILLIGYSNRNC